MPYENYINLESELDRPIYRIMPVNRLLQCLEETRLILVPPMKWDDPFENYLLSARVKLYSTGETGSMDGMRDKVYAQCWTQHRETDAMWRIYSSDASGAKVKTTPRRLLEALKQTDRRFSDIRCFIGKVQYQKKSDLVASLKGIDLFNTNGAGIAKSFLYKRREFSHEKEIRLIYTHGDGAIHSIPIDPSAMFDEIVFDPRMDGHLYKAYAAAVKAKKFSGRVAQSGLYKPPPGLMIKL